MGFDIHKNNAISTVATAPSPALSGLSLVVAAGEGTKFPAGPFNAVVWAANSSNPTTLNSEIVRVTSVSTDTFTITRAQETGFGGPAARSIIVGDQIMLAITAKTLQDVENAIPTQGFRGLAWRTHFDADKEANQVVLTALDEATMSDGWRYSGLTLPLAADITAGGAAGLDTGARNASTWYEAHLIGKSSSKLVSDLRLILHRAKDYKFDQNPTAGTAAAANLRAAAGNTLDAYPVVPTLTGLLEIVDTNISRVASPVGRVWLEVRADNAGVPSASVLATSDKFDASRLSTSAEMVRFPFRSPVSLTSGTTYWLVWNGDYTISAVNYVVINGTAVAGLLAQFNGTTWSTGLAQKLNFKTYMTENDTALTFPAGYDQSCKLGYVYNSSGNVLVGFVGRNRREHFLTHQFLGTTGSTFEALVDVSGFLPPGAISFNAWLGTGLAGTSIWVGGVPDAYDAVGTTVDGAGQMKGSIRMIDPNGAGGPYLPTDAIFTEYQGIYIFVSASTGHYSISQFEW